MTPSFSVEKLKANFKYDPIAGTRERITRGHGQRKRVGYFDRNGYLRFTLFGERHLGHVLAWYYMTGVWPDRIVDHEDNIPSNIKWKNLRLATRTQNRANSKCRSDNQSGLKGVYRRVNTWRAVISARGKLIHLGCFASPEQAHEAYVVAAKKEFSQFARPK